MKQLILVSHGSFADGLKTSLAMFAGDKIDQVMAVGLKNGADVDDLAVEFSRRLEEDNIDSGTGLIVLADIIGGSPLTTVCNVLEKRGLLDGAVILGGMNLPMALNALVMKDVMSGDEFATTVLSEARNAVQEFRIGVSDDEEDDI
ncbi:PTS fructose transporter subunit IIA [Ligilactobacillus ruminis]|uniref:PTS sugar transporter subunit IIA n=1 Tax=Ligilactobacillus ruminis TaxID=1623 RepID=UPI001F47B817|nr:PTS fructose transporter subunit IIA [Ligilactobacillus ruminis]MCF2544745.1 PTS fructose transporter subunit IIA [Ligilactobacillus ruminis]MCR5749683.1 PTS fructose transporter subunit IIA [Lactobacillus sp.]MDD6171135.1 PTS fructose transporter subunit IIA [Ligilactobacillus ruminis]